MVKTKIKESKVNLGILLAFFLAIIVGLGFALFSFKVIGITSQGGTIFNYIGDFFSGDLNFKGAGIWIYLMILSYIFIILMYFLSGIGSLEDKFANYASIISFLYFVLGLLAVNSINNQTSVNILGQTLNSARANAGIYIIPIIGVIHLLFAKSINSAIKK